MELRDGIDRVVGGIEGWAASFGPVDAHPSLALDEGRVTAVLDDLVERLHDNYPFFHPRYAGQRCR